MERELRARLGAVSTLVFDVMGTVVDDEGSIAVWTAAALQRYEVDLVAAELVKRANGLLSQAMDDVRHGRLPWRSHFDLRRSAMGEALAADGLVDPEPSLVSELATVIAHLEAWPDSSSALADLRRRFTVVALSNADVVELAGLSRHADLAWHLALSGELVRSFKSDPAVYAVAPDLLKIPAEQLMMVAAHPWDLRTAASLGFRTAYIARPGAQLPAADDAFDITANDFSDLAVQLG